MQPRREAYVVRSIEDWRTITFAPDHLQARCNCFRPGSYPWIRFNKSLWGALVVPVGLLAVLFELDRCDCQCGSLGRKLYELLASLFVAGRHKTSANCTSGALQGSRVTITKQDMGKWATIVYNVLYTTFHYSQIQYWTIGSQYAVSQQRSDTDQ